MSSLPAAQVSIPNLAMPVPLSLYTAEVLPEQGIRLLLLIQGGTLACPRE